jgi:BirA family biotin operon repressor/biotin-[acetyl-CoA-carboxylase] ligase
VDHVVVGCGLNVAQRSEDFPPDIRPSATSLTMESGRPDPFILLREYLARLRSLYGDGGDGLAERLRRPYAALCETLGRDVRAVTVSGAQVLGVAEEIGPLGELILRDPAGRRHTVRFGEVERVR